MPGGDQSSKMELNFSDIASPIRGFQNLMRNRVHEILLVSSLYDSFILSQDGHLNVMMIGEFTDMNLYHTPNLTRVSSSAEALEAVHYGPRFNLIITTSNIGEMHGLEFARTLKAENRRVPIVLLAYDQQEVNELIERYDTSALDHIFLWQGDFTALLAIVKLAEDKKNVDHDTHMMGVQTILLVEDNVKFYSAYLPAIYTEVMKQSQNLISEGLNLPDKLLRMRARPKILHATTYEQAWEYYTRYEEYMLGVLTDIEFLHGGKKDSRAGVELAQQMRKRRPELPILMQSFDGSNAERAQEVGANFAKKNSPTLLKELRAFMMSNFGFGDFIFRKQEGGEELDRAVDLRSLQTKLQTVPAECLVYHGQRDHFSTWLKARTEFDLAQKLKPRKVEDYGSPEDLRLELIESLGTFRQERRRALVTDFDPINFEASGTFAVIGEGSLGGKARGLAFANRLIELSGLRDEFSDIEISVPPTVVLSTDIFDKFMEANDLWEFALHCEDDEKLTERFLQAELPEAIEANLRFLTELMDCPLAVRSSSLLEDSQYQPFAGVYETFMLANDHPDPTRRIDILAEVIKRIYCSTFKTVSKRYIKATAYRLEEEKMAVMIQSVVGAPHEDRFYPDVSGVAKSHNFYPVRKMKSSDGVAMVALGLGATVVDGGKVIRFCPRYPKHMHQFGTVDDYLDNTQREFYALKLHDEVKEGMSRITPQLFDLSVAEKDNTLHRVASVYSPDNEAVYDGLSRKGVRLVTFAPILKHNLFPLPEIVRSLLELGAHGMGRAVELEFAVNLSTPRGKPKEFMLLQMRPMVLQNEMEELDFGAVREKNLLCRSKNVLGMGKVDTIRDIVLVDREKYDRADSRRVADIVGKMNGKLMRENRPYLLIGVGRWGSSDPFLGIPVHWGQIAGARVIVETGFKDMKVTPSQGAHFFHNLTAFRVGYFTVNPDKGDGMLDWEWLKNAPVVEEDDPVRHLRFIQPLEIKMNGKNNAGIISKPPKR